MKKQKHNRGNGIYARLSRIEIKCDRIYTMLGGLVQEPRQDEIDSLISNLRATARRMADRCRDERKHYEFLTRKGNRYEL